MFIDQVYPKCTHLSDMCMVHGIWFMCRTYGVPESRGQYFGGVGTVFFYKATVPLGQWICLPLTESE
jgi:hypothetical protein